MAKLDPFIERKAQAIAERQADFSANPGKSIATIKASSWVGGVTGTRPTRMGDYTIISDSAPGLGGNSLGPTSPEMLLGALASCLVHTYLIQATLLHIPLDHVEIEVQAQLDFAGVVGLPVELPPQMHNISYHPRVTSPASEADIQRLHEAIEPACPVLNTLRNPTSVQRSG